MNLPIYSLEQNLQPELAIDYQRAISELNKFFGIGWEHHLPRLFVLTGRAAVDQWHGKTGTQMSGWTHGSHQLYIIDKETYIAEKGSWYEEDMYFMLIKHEMAHCFHQIVSGYSNLPVWLWEGVATFVSGQNKYIEAPGEFYRFLDSTTEHKPGVYEESGYIVALLVGRFGKQKLLELLKRLGEGDFEELFTFIYGGKPTYEFFNQLRSLLKISR